MPSRGESMMAADLLHNARAQERAGAIPEAIAAYEAAIAAAEIAEEQAVLAEALRRLAVVRHQRAESADARDLCLRSHVVARRAGNGVLAGEALNPLGGIDLETDAIADARHNFLLALELGGQSRALRARVEQNLGVLANIQGDFDEAQARYRGSLEAYRAANDEHGCAIAYHNLGMVSADLQQLDEAEGYFRQSYEIAQRAGDVHLQGLCLVNHADVHVLRERYTDAQGKAEAALAIFDQLDALSDKSEASRELALLYQAMGRNQDALTLLNTAHRLFGRLQARVDLVHVASKVAELEATYLAVVREWGQSIESSDSYTFGHCERVARRSVAVARALRMDEHAQTTVRLGAYLHDLGKVRVPLEILSKPGPLTRDEFEVVQMHPIWGIELIADVEFPWDLKPIIRWHHERYDGTGYPDRLRGDEIPLSAQVVGIADVYDALTTTRPYRPAFSPAAARAEIERCCGLWSDHVYKAFLTSLAQPQDSERSGRRRSGGPADWRTGASSHVAP